MTCTSPLQSPRPSDRGTASLLPSLSPSHLSLVSLLVGSSMISSLVISSLVDAAGVDEGGVHVIECKEFVPTTLGLMDACNEDDRNSVCAISSGCLVSFFCPAALSCCLARCLFLISFLVATCRCILLCLPLALLSTALSEAAVPGSSLLCWSLFSVVSYSCLVCRYLSCLFA